MVRETLSLDMIDRLVTDICSVTEDLMKSDTFDLAAWQPVTQSVEVRAMIQSRTALYKQSQQT